MNAGFFKHFSDIEVKEIAPGYLSKFIHTADNTINFVDVAAGIVPTHQHVHEQLSFVLAGEFELSINGEAQLLTKDMYAIIPPNVLHSGRAVTYCKLIDVFSPVRRTIKNYNGFINPTANI